LPALFCFGTKIVTWLEAFSIFAMNTTPAPHFGRVPDTEFCSRIFPSYAPGAFLWLDHLVLLLFEYTSDHPVIAQTFFFGYPPSHLQNNEKINQRE
jgi:hypothetical protein